MGLRLGAMVDCPGTGEGAGVGFCPVSCPTVIGKSQTGLKQQGLAASLVRRHCSGTFTYCGHLKRTRC